MQNSPKDFSPHHAPENVFQAPPKEREDLRYGDPHNPRGSHEAYGPDSYAMTERETNKPPMESHGFYPAAGQPQPQPSLWQRIKAAWEHDAA